MRVWLSNLAAFSVQLAALVATGAIVLAALRLKAPRATLRLWQIIFALSLVWPAYQLWASESTSGFISLAHWRALFTAGALGNAASEGATELRAGLAAVDTGVVLLLTVVLTTGAFIRLGALGLGLMRLRSIRSTSRAAPELSEIAAPLFCELGVTAEIRYSDAVTSPATIGVRRPVVLLPAHACTLSQPVKRAVLCHELIHVRRRDWLATLGDEVWCAALWFHPAARALASRLGLARETVVDEATIAHTRDRRAYAAALLEFSTARSGLVGTTALIGRRHLERRIALIAQEASMSHSALRVRLAIAAVAVAIATIATASYFPISTTLQAQTEKVYRPGNGVTLPQVVKEVLPQYTPAAMQARIEGAVWMAVVVLASGDVGRVTVSRSLDKEHGLDQQAADAARQWKFTPATKDGKPVAVEVTIEMTFALKK